MHAIRQGEKIGEDALRAIQAGVDLLLLGPNPEDQQRVSDYLRHSIKQNFVSLDEMDQSYKLIFALKTWLSGGTKPDLNVVGSSAHRRIADLIAARPLTLVRDHAKSIPISLKADEKIIILQFRPTDVTPADTSAFIPTTFGDFVRKYHPDVAEITLPNAPSDDDIATVINQSKRYQLVLISTQNAFNQPGQASLVHRVIQSGLRTIVAAVRLPYDLSAFPEATTYVCTYGLLEPPMNSLVIYRSPYRVSTPLVPRLLTMSLLAEIN